MRNIITNLFRSRIKHRYCFYLRFIQRLCCKSGYVALNVWTSDVTCCGPGQLSWYSDLLRAGRSRDRIPVGARFSAPIQTSPGAYPASYTMGSLSFLGVKRPGRGLNNPPHLSPSLKKEQSYTSTPPMGLGSLLQGETYHFTFAVKCDLCIASSMWTLGLCLSYPFTYPINLQTSR